MNVVKILLVLGLGYVALNQKSEKTRNMLLVVTGLLAFCMFSVEGFGSITFNDSSTVEEAAAAAALRTAALGPVAALAAAGVAAATTDTSDASSGGTITSTNNGDYVFSADFNLETGLPIPTYTCDSSKVKGGMVNSGGPLSAATVEDAYPCVPPTETCASGKTSLPRACPEFYTDKAGASCAAAKCVNADFNTITQQCCNPPCPDDKCHWWLLPFGHGDKCGVFSRCEE